MPTDRKTFRLVKSRPTIEGAGVHLNRVFGFGETTAFDPFLLLDDFRSDDPRKFLPGFPWHPHRGIETVTYMIEGAVEHGDSMGNRGTINEGDVQWMTAGSGVIHQEMPQGNRQNRMGGFQLWANLPASQKMMDPRYREVKRGQIPEVNLGEGVTAKVISGVVNGICGPVRGIVTDPEYLDVAMAPGKTFTRNIAPGRTVFAYCIGGAGYFDSSRSHLVENKTLVLFGDGELVTVTADTESVRFLLVSGSPLREPVAWRGPIVMNTQQELQIAFEEYENGTFIRSGHVR